MNDFVTCILIGISLSMDAFSLALIYGTYGFSTKNQIIISFIVGIFHFFMPLFGLYFGNLLMHSFYFNANLVVGIIFFIIGLEMILSIHKEEKVSILSSFFGYIFFGFTVSIDSFTTGIGLFIITNHYYMVVTIFMLCSSFFTFLGFFLGDKLNQCFGKYATFLGGVIMIVLAVMYIL